MVVFQAIAGGGAVFVERTKAYAFISNGCRETSLEAKAKAEAVKIGQDGKEISGEVKEGAERLLAEAKQKTGELKDKLKK